MSEKKQCAVKGMLVAPAGKRYGAMCGYVICSSNKCGFDGECEHQRDPQHKQDADHIADSGKKGIAETAQQEGLA